MALNKSRKYASITTAEVLYRFYDFLVNSGQTAYRLVNDTGSAVALYKQGTGFVASWASSADSPSGSYLVFEPVAANGGVRQQTKILLTTNSLTFRHSPTGTWTNAGAAFSATCQTGDIQFNDNAAPAAGSETYFTCGTVAYGSGQTYPYFWANIRDTADASALQFMYVGGYTPFNPATDTKPACCVARIPQLSDNTSYVGRAATSADSLCRGPIEYAQTSSWAAAGYARLGLIDAAGAGNPGATAQIRNIGGEYIGLPVYLIANAGGYWHGHFGEHMQVIDAGKADYDTNNATPNPNKIVIGHLFLDYNEVI